MTTQELERVFSPIDNHGEIHDYEGARGGYIDDTFPMGQQPYPLDSDEQVETLITAGSRDLRTVTLTVLAGLSCIE